MIKPSLLKPSTGSSTVKLRLQQFHSVKLGDGCQSLHRMQELSIETRFAELQLRHLIGS